ncbi:hypothetical protein EPI10_011683 [Gossypium australe]|uniref:Uncharacterized protein n=1 Tax=Gossypium australe TaxID=47621 RepID=A0A5B6WAH2_9ROSI|nr:hypothetical protein EPI10_011683 [Gossypium australe]
MHKLPGMSKHETNNTRQISPMVLRHRHCMARHRSTSYPSMPRFFMTQSSSTLIKPYLDLGQLLRHNCEAMNTDPPAVINLPRGNLLFEDLREQQGNDREEVPMAQLTLCEYALPKLDAVRGSIERLTINANNSKSTRPLSK